MKKLFYPALFHKAEEGGFWVSFPDLPECLTDGEEATSMGVNFSQVLQEALIEKLQSRP